MESNNKDLSKKLNDKNESCQCNRLRDENEMLISSKRDLELQLTQYEALLVELKAKMDQDEKKYDTTIEDFKRIADLTNESCTTMQNEINSLKREKASLTSDCDTLRKENERLNAAKSSLTSARDRFNTTLQGSLSCSSLSPTFASSAENNKKQIPADVRLKSRHTSMDVDKNSKTDHEIEDYKILKSKYAELKDRYNRKVDDFKKKEDTWNQERKTAQVNYESMEHSYKTKIEKIEADKEAKIKHEKMKCYEDLNVVYRKDADILRTERDSARSERDSALKEVEDYASKVKKLSIMSSMNFAPWKQQMISMKEEIRLLKVDYIMMKDEWVRNLKSLTDKISELINDRQSLENNFNTLVPFVYSVVSKSHSLSEKFRQLKTENDRLSVAIEMSMSTKAETEEKMDVSEHNTVVDNDASECDKLKQKIDFMATEKTYFENEAISKQIRAEELEIQLVQEQNKRCRIEFEVDIISDVFLLLFSLSFLNYFSYTKANSY